MVRNPEPSTVVEAIDALDNDISIRKLKCSQYDKCLDQAAALRWQGFKCIDCCVDDPISVDQDKSDIEQLTELLCEVFRPGSWDVKDGEDMGILEE